MSLTLADMLRPGVQQYVFEQIALNRSPATISISTLVERTISVILDNNKGRGDDLMPVADAFEKAWRDVVG